MYDLPYELQTMIYEFDSTYKEKFDQVLQSRYEILKVKNQKLYFIFDYFTEHTYTTNCLKNPTFLTTTYTFFKRKRPDKPIQYHIYNFKNFLFTKYDIIEINDDKINFDPLNISFH